MRTPQGTNSFGSATALVAALCPSGEAKLGVANLGDSGLRRHSPTSSSYHGNSGYNIVIYHV